MNTNIDLYQKRIISPIWNASINISSCGALPNVFPVRTQHHSRRFFSKSQSRRPMNNPEFFLSSNEESSSDYYKQRAHTTMAFCSTSRIKHLPLPGFNPDEFAGLSLGTNHPTIFTGVSNRPVSRPVLLHGKRFTMLPQQPQQQNDQIRSSTGFSNCAPSEDHVVLRQQYSASNHNSSLQRHRFLQAEKLHQLNRIHKTNTNENATENSMISRNYLVTGRRLFPFEQSNHSARRAPQLNGLPSLPTKPQEIICITNLKSTDTTNLDTDNEEQQHEQVEIEDEIKEIVETKEQTEDVLEEIEDIQKKVEHLIRLTQEIPQEDIDIQREWLLGHLQAFLNDIKDLDILDYNDLMGSFNQLSPNQINTDDQLPQELLNLQGMVVMSEDNDSVSLSDLLSSINDIFSDKITSELLSKIFQLFNQENISQSQLTSTLYLINLFIPNSVLSHLSITRALFWLDIHLNHLTLSKQDVDETPANAIGWLIVGRSVSSNDSVIQSIISHIPNKEIQTINQIKQIHLSFYKLYSSHFSIDDLASIKALFCRLSAS